MKTFLAILKSNIIMKHLNVLVSEAYFKVPGVNYNFRHYVSSV